MTDPGPDLAQRSIGVFDSGVGGLTVLRALIDELPAERFIYLGDTARLPYGTKTAETVARYSVQAADALVALGVKCLVIACNTASAAGLPAIRDRVRPLPVIGVIEPGAEAACAASPSGHIAVIATESTVRGGAYQRAILEHRPGAHVHAVAAQLFVALAEEGLTEGPLAESAARHYLGGLFAADSAPPLRGSPAGASGKISHPDTLVLGCTHFPVLLAPIRAAVGQHVRIVDSARTTARAVRDALAAAGIAARGAAAAERAVPRLLATDGAERFARVGGQFLGCPIEPEQIELIDL